MDLATSRIINETEDIFDYMTKEEYNQFVCGFYRHMTPSEAELEYLKAWEENNKVYEKLY